MSLKINAVYPHQLERFMRSGTSVVEGAVTFSNGDVSNITWSVTDQSQASLEDVLGVVRE